MKKFLREYSIYIAWGCSLFAMMGSLYYSEIMHLPPCVLCWYLRIAIYPLVFVLGAAILLKNRLIHWYVLPLTLIGLGVSIFHNLLYYNVITESLAPCVAGISCTTRLVQFFGVPIQTQGLIAIVLINLFLIIHWRTNRND